MTTGWSDTPLIMMKLCGEEGKKHHGELYHHNVANLEAVVAYHWRRRLWGLGVKKFGALAYFLDILYAKGFVKVSLFRHCGTLVRSISRDFDL